MEPGVLATEHGPHGFKCCPRTKAIEHKGPTREQDRVRSFFRRKSCCIPLENVIAEDESACSVRCRCSKNDCFPFRGCARFCQHRSRVEWKEIQISIQTGAFLMISNGPTGLVKVSAKLHESCGRVSTRRERSATECKMSRYQRQECSKEGRNHVRQQDQNSVLC
jgi:hypothetical protein